MDMHRVLRDPWVWGQALLILAVVAGIPALQRGAGGPVADWLTPSSISVRLPGLLPIVLGVTLALWGATSLGPNLTPATQPGERAVLVQTGPYRLVRHPVYLGVTLILAGTGWLYANPAIAALVGLVALLFFGEKAAVEERWMRSRFPEYAEYASRVPRLLPRLWR